MQIHQLQPAPLTESSTNPKKRHLHISWQTTLTIGGTDDHDTILHSHLHSGVIWTDSVISQVNRMVAGIVRGLHPLPPQHCDKLPDVGCLASFVNSDREFSKKLPNGVILTARGVPETIGFPSTSGGPPLRPKQEKEVAIAQVYKQGNVFPNQRVPRLIYSIPAPQLLVCYIQS